MFYMIVCDQRKCSMSLKQNSTKADQSLALEGSHFLLRNLYQKCQNALVVTDFVSEIKNVEN